MPRASRLLAATVLAAVTTIAAACAIDDFCTEGDVGCAADACQNRLRDGDESDVDCGGACAPCAGGARCGRGGDCASGRCFQGACCEPPCVVAARRFGGEASEQARSGVRLPDGTLVIAGEMTGTVDLGAGPLISAGNADVFVAAFAPDGGALRWARRIGAEGHEFSPRLAVGPNGHVWLAMLFSSAELDTGAGVVKSSGGYQQIVVIELDAQGAPQQARTFGNQGTTTSIGGVAATADGGLMLLGGLGRVDFGDGTVLVSTNGPFPGGPRDTFVARLDAKLQRVWHRQIGDADNDDTFGMTLDAAGNVTIGLHTMTATDVGGPPLDGPGLVLASYDGADGAHRWSRSYGDNVWGASLSANAAGDLFIAGNLYGEADLGAGKLLRVGTVDALLARFDPTGAPLWSIPIPGSVSSSSHAVLPDPKGGVVAAIQLTGTLDLPGGVSAPLGVDSLAFVRLDAGGQVEWARNEGGLLVGSTVGLVDGPSGHVISYGGYSGTLSLGALGPSAGEVDTFVAELLP